MGLDTSPALILYTFSLLLSARCFLHFTLSFIQELESSVHFQFHQIPLYRRCPFRFFLLHSFFSLPASHIFMTESSRLLAPSRVVLQPLLLRLLLTHVALHTVQRLFFLFLCCYTLVPLLLLFLLVLPPPCCTEAILSYAPNSFFSEHSAVQKLQKTN